MFRLNIPITKSKKIEKHKLVVCGVASDPTIDRDMERFDTSAIKKMTEAVNKGGIPIRLEHENKVYTQIGKWTKASFDKDYRMSVEGEVDTELSLGHDLEILLERGEPIALSVGGRVLGAGYEYNKDIDKNVKVYTDVALDEISVVRNPANYNASLSLAKSVDWGKLSIAPVSAAQTTEAQRLTAIYKSMKHVSNEAFTKALSMSAAPTSLSGRADNPSDAAGRKIVSDSSGSDVAGRVIVKSWKELVDEHITAEVIKSTEKVYKDYNMELPWVSNNGELNACDMQTIVAVSKFLDKVEIPEGMQPPAELQDYNFVNALGDECFVILPSGSGTERVLPHHNADYSVNKEWLGYALQSLFGDGAYWKPKDYNVAMNHLFYHLKEESMLKMAKGKDDVKMSDGPKVPTIRTTEDSERDERGTREEVKDDAEKSKKQDKKTNVKDEDMAQDMDKKKKEKMEANDDTGGTMGKDDAMNNAERDEKGEPMNSGKPKKTKKADAEATIQEKERKLLASIKTEIAEIEALEDAEDKEEVGESSEKSKNKDMKSNKTDVKNDKKEASFTDEQIALMKTAYDLRNGKSDKAPIVNGVSADYATTIKLAAGYEELLKAGAFNKSSDEATTEDTTKVEDVKTEETSKEEAVDTTVKAEETVKTEEKAAEVATATETTVTEPTEKTETTVEPLETEAQKTAKFNSAVETVAKSIVAKETESFSKQVDFFKSELAGLSSKLASVEKTVSDQNVLIKTQDELLKKSVETIDQLTKRVVTRKSIAVAALEKTAPTIESDASTVKKTEKDVEDDFIKTVNGLLDKGKTWQEAYKEAKAMSNQ